MDFLIEFINDIIELVNDDKIDNRTKFIKFSSIILNEQNRIFIGCIFILVSFIIYFIDNTT